jgi:aspartate/methionine/tyrosine aminotransferase
MIRAPRYLAWAVEHYGRVPFDLASSGIAPVTLHEMEGTGGASVADINLDDPDGPAKLRRAIAEFNGVPVAEAVPALGTTHALWLAYSSVLEPGDDVLVEAPSYEPIWTLAQAAGARLVRFERRAEDRFALDVDAIARALTPRTRVVAIASPHNPSGRVTDAATLGRIAELLAPRGAYLLVDEVYAPLSGEMAPGSLVWGQTARRLGANVLAVSSLTKCFGLGRDRVGWVLASERVAKQAEEVLLATCGSLPLRHANHGAAAFTRVDVLLQRARELTAGKQAVVEAWMASRGDLVWSQPEGGVFGFAVRNEPGDLLSVIEEGARRHEVLVAAGSFFGVPEGFRLSWTLPREKLAPALERLGRVLDGAGPERTRS